MNIVLRIVTLLMVVTATYYFMYWVPFSFISLGEMGWIANLLSALCGIGAGWYIWINTKNQKTTKKKLIPSIFYGAAILGSIGFIGGFFGPIIFSPSSNQGPLLGLFITGPLGFVLGGFGGFVQWLINGSESELEK